MDKVKELQTVFENEISTVSNKEIAAIEREIDDMKTRTFNEFESAAKQKADLYYEQEISEIDGEHAIALSHLNDDNTRKLMQERDQMVKTVFEEAKKQVIAFTKDAAYKDKLISKLKNLKDKQFTPAKLFVSPADEKLLKDLLKAYELECEGSIDESIQLGGFRLECPQKGVIVDETFDRAMIDSKQWFLQNSGLTIR